MNMVCHPAICMDPAMVALNSLSQQAHPATPVKISEKYWLAAIASENYVINAAWHMNSGFAWHPCLIVNRLPAAYTDNNRSPCCVSSTFAQILNTGTHLFPNVCKG
jgi:hypothetical protein